MSRRLTNTSHEIRIYVYIGKERCFEHLLKLIFFTYFINVIIYFLYLKSYEDLCAQA